jgi:thioredoxin reductase/Pyruvate/2-oxoacid:ferredoxin oxidoreductase delta subunit
MYDFATLALYFTPMLLVVYIYVRRRQTRLRADAAVRAETIAAGLTEPASLHPVIDKAKCIGCAACAEVCPEMPGHTVIGIVNGKAELVSPTDCIGHGACQAACPVGAIDLVFGTEKRGIDIPAVGTNFETNVPGIYIAGELGGMGLIRNAIEQGRQAMDHIAQATRGTHDLDVLVVGAGPAGIAASLGAMEKKLNCVTIEQESLGGTVAHFPRGKLVMTAPAQLPIVGKMRFRETSKEKLLKFWQDVQKQTGLQVNFKERVEKIERQTDGFAVQTTKAIYYPAKILLCLGRRGTPRKLGVPGEELPKVAYSLIEPEQFHGMSVLIVGGGDSALEAACTLAESDNIDVTIAYRSAAFTRAKARNRQAAATAEQEGRLKILLRSEVTHIYPDKVALVKDNNPIELQNDAVIINAGGILPTSFLQSIGISVETKYGSR